MSGEKSIAKLLSGMRPSLNEGDYVFCCVADPGLVKDEEVLGSFREKEGLTVIIERSRAQALGLDFDYVAAWITLTVHSALDAVGLTAAFATALGNAGISCNVIAAYYHDHIFVGREDAQRAIEVLEALARSGGSDDCR
ncbi:ACT domain-containing protein [Pseudomonas sp. OA65]|uniref:ACT domain-containing protein n=1 Tax=Pseudomonas sp. OA65 TaxID=2818431 RepID=UPI001A9F9FA1|nr:ACT domain-containing protein [Pseudomonas sp. OA65]MBO1537354.1 ACT domain-containing protein [Pseudomonas sp. OA65]